MPGVAGVAAIGAAGSIGTGLLGAESARKASQAQQATQQQALAEQRRQFEITRQNLQPFIGAGQTGLQGLEQGATAQGLDQRLADILGGGAFQQLAGERTRAAQAGLASAGLTRSGAGLQAIAGVPGDLALQLEGLLGGRQGQLAGLGQQTAAQLGGLGQGFAGQQSNLLSQLGQTQAQGILGGQQAIASGIGQGLGFLQQFGQAQGIQGQPQQATPQQFNQVAFDVGGSFLPGGAAAARVPGAAEPLLFPAG